jgi:ApbE superfamily uncharacterized protein (UPF0280 family)
MPWGLKGKARICIPMAGGALHVTARRDVSADAHAAARQFLEDVRAYVVRDPDFVEARGPIHILAGASPIVSQMGRLSALVGVGPSVTLRGALVECVGLAITRTLDEVAVSSRGHHFVVTDRREQVPLPSPQGLCLIVRPQLGAHGISISSGRFSSLHDAGILAVVADSCILAGAGATAVTANLSRFGSVRGALAALKRIPGIYGALLVQSDRIDVVGSLEVSAHAGPRKAAPSLARRGFRWLRDDPGEAAVPSIHPQAPSRP